MQPRPACGAQADPGAQRRHRRPVVTDQPVEFDFSQFHDLAHPLWLCLVECALHRNQHGGWQRHLTLTWDYTWQPGLRAAHGYPLEGIGEPGQPASYLAPTLPE